MSFDEKYFLGIDIGSVSIGAVILDAQNNIVINEYLFHHGNIPKVLAGLLNSYRVYPIYQFAYNHKAADFFNFGLNINDQIAQIEGVFFKHDRIGSLFIIGGETFGLILFDDNNHYHKFISNSSCAAGTGAFLDQQAGRLGLADSAELSQLTQTFKGDPPKIATRCAVFAKTDLIHSQQMGFSVEAISAGLCQGLAQNIADTLIKGIRLKEPVFVIGGVSQNKKVMAYLSDIIGLPVKTSTDARNAGAMGCALQACRNPGESAIELQSVIKSQTENKQYFFPALEANLSVFYDQKQRKHDYFLHGKVEVDVYKIPEAAQKLKVYLGIDIGSTSTKAVVYGAEKSYGYPITGFYTKTAGQPLQATQLLLKSIDHVQKRYGIEFDIIAAGTTGSGRKFIQKIIKADTALDEITAHARAAYRLNPKVDTIIEIGGQDAKFTVMKNGQVTFSVMNYVCAAGTGSFIEEQAKRLDVSLADYSDRATGIPSPLTSDRCTVFMERDLNHLMSKGYETDELLAAVLHSVRDNYLAKVAHLNKIGDIICFQGATAKNKALVMAFEQKLQKPIFVSQYCHLTGALGVCLILQEQKIKNTKFRGIDFYKETLHVEDEICEDCKNHCKLKTVKIGKEQITWGFLCGKDEKGKRKIKKNIEFDLLSRRSKVFNQKEIQRHDKNGQKTNIDLSLDKITEGFGLNLLEFRHAYYKINNRDMLPDIEKKKIKIGIPNSLYMFEFIPFWKLFFTKLGYSVVVSVSRDDFISKGKEISGAEFCAPISSWHGHIQFLSKKADYVFIPHMFDETVNDQTQYFCYYSNYAVALAQNSDRISLDEKCISPVVDFTDTSLQNVQRIYDCLPQNLKLIQTPSELLEAYHQTFEWYKNRRQYLVNLFKAQKEKLDDVSVTLLGRPYIVLSKGMNKGIPDKINDLGIRTFYQDMIPPVKQFEHPRTQEFAEWNHWRFGNVILNASEYIARNQGLYPVFLTAFKCSPDSFILSYFKDIMDNYQKPYLVLQIDEHGSAVGYETRIEAAIRSFRNHAKQKHKTVQSGYNSPILFKYDQPGTMLIPNYDIFSCSLICAAFENAGYKTRLIEESEDSVLSSLRLNDGQCLPVSAILQSAMETIEKHKLDPENTALFMNTITKLSCNFPQYPMMAKKILEERGNGFEKVKIFATEFDMRRFPVELIKEVYLSYLLGGLLKRIACHIRPYEIVAGQTDKYIEKARKKLYGCIASGNNKEEIFQQIVDELALIPVDKSIGKRPKVTLIGDLYVRDNDIFNQQLIRELEAYGAEVVITPFTYILRLLAVKHKHRLWEGKQYLSLLRDKIMIDILERMEKRYYQTAHEILDEDFPAFDATLFDRLQKFNMSFLHRGETSQNVVKIYSLLQHYPDLSMIINVNPIFCCPGLVSESIFKKVEEDIGIPIISITYDGTTTRRNEILAPYLHYLKT